MNGFINGIDAIPFSVTKNISITVTQTCLLYAFIVFVSYWLMQKRNPMLKYGLAILLAFSISRITGIIQQQQRRAIIVYNTPKYKAMDLVQGKAYFFIGDDTCRQDGFFRNFHLSPSRILYGLTEADSLTGLRNNSPYLFFENKAIILLDASTKINTAVAPVNVDIVVLSQNIKYPLSLVRQAFSSQLYVFDGSNSSWKIRQWKNECDSLHLRRHSVPDDGAFVLDF